MLKENLQAAVDSELLKKYKNIRKHTTDICKPLKTEDFVVQPMADASPPKWHLGHTTWFFEAVVLKNHLKGYEEFDPQYSFIFNSYYQSLGTRISRVNRGNLSRPTVEEILKYREYVDEAMGALLNTHLPENVQSIIVTGINHEQQHQELLLTDIKFILGNNPLFPPYDIHFRERAFNNGKGYTSIEDGLYEIGFKSKGFCYDNELKSHPVYLGKYSISNALITNGEYLEFINDGGYKDFILWHSDGWDWVNENKIEAPLYWHLINNQWYAYDLDGLKPLDESAILKHVSYYEAFAFAQWKSQRLPSEFEWEAAAPHVNWGSRWEWTESSYLPYPGFKKLPGALGEYNGKFMVSQKVLRGASSATPLGHSRKTYRNFFYPQQRWQFTGIRLAK